MARNETIILTDVQTTRVQTWSDLLTGMEGETLRVDYVKRDGTEATLIGTMVDLYGSTPDHKVVRMETEKGPRSANLYLVHGVDYA